MSTPVFISLTVVVLGLLMAAWGAREAWLIRNHLNAETWYLRNRISRLYPAVLIGVCLLAFGAGWAICHLVSDVGCS
jgi:hypothetical protein